MTLEEFLAPLLEEAAQQANVENAVRFLLSALTTNEEYEFPLFTDQNATSLAVHCSVYWLLETQASPTCLHLSLCTSAETLVKHSLFFHH